MTISRAAGSSGAESKISGEISIYATWNEDIYFFDPSDGSAMGLTGIDFELQFRKDAGQTSADVTLSITAGTLSLQDDSGSVKSILRIAAPAGTFTNYEGDMIADLVAQDVSDNVIHYGHGIVSFRNDPVAFS